MHTSNKNSRFATTLHVTEANKACSLICIKLVSLNSLISNQIVH